MAKANPRKIYWFTTGIYLTFFYSLWLPERKNKLTEKQTSISLYWFIVYGYKNQLILNIAISLSLKLVSLTVTQQYGKVCTFVCHTEGLLGSPSRSALTQGHGSLNGSDFTSPGSIWSKPSSLELPSPAFLFSKKLPRPLHCVILYGKNWNQAVKYKASNWIKTCH